MRIGLVSPVLMQQPGVSSAWEADAGVDELTSVVTTADRLGYHHVTCPEHVAVPADDSGRRGTVYWDPLATLSYLAAVTDRVRLVTQVLVLGYHHPLAVAKRYGTLDRLSGGRLVLGVGVGTLEAEFRLLGARFEGRGERADEAIRAIRAAFASSRPVHGGAHYSFDGFVLEPTAVQACVPIWIGGRTRRSLHRALSLGDGWVPFGNPPETLGGLLSDAAPPRPEFEVVLPTGRPLDPQDEPQRTLDALLQVHRAGATIANVAIKARSAEDYCDQLEALRDLSVAAAVARFPTATDAPKG